MKVDGERREGGGGGYNTQLGEVFDARRMPRELVRTVRKIHNAGAARWTIILI